MLSPWVIAYGAMLNANAISSSTTLSVLFFGTALFALAMTWRDSRETV